MVRIYPVVEVKDFVYGHRHGWLDALLQAADGFMLRPERELGRAFAARLTLRQYLARRYGVRLDGGVIMMDHGIMSQSFSETFGLAKTPKNIVCIYKVLGVPTQLGRRPFLNTESRQKRLDVPGAQIMHSDVYVLVRVGVFPSLSDAAGSAP